MEEYAQYYTQVTVSVITYYKIRRGLVYRDAHQHLKQFEDLMANSEIIPLTISIVQEATSVYAQLRASGQLLPDADLLIAATALKHDIILVTNNIQHFDRVAQLEIENWMR